MKGAVTNAGSDPSSATFQLCLRDRGGLLSPLMLPHFVTMDGAHVGEFS